MRNHRIEYLDATRGLAALSVVCSHYILSFGLPRGTERWLSDTPLHFWWDGFAAVSFFFVLSGFVLSLRFFGEGPRSEFKYRDYLVARIFRIWLPYFAVFSGCLLAWRFLKQDWVTSPETTSWFQGFWNDRLGWADFLRESFLLKQSGYRVIAPAWTLSIELLISFFVPLVAILSRKRPLRVLFAFVLLAAIAHTRLFGLHFVLGIFLARIYRERSELFRQWSPIAFGSVLGLGFLFYTFRYSVAPDFPGLFSDRVIWYATGVGALALISCVLASGRVQRVLSHPWLRFLGKISYSLYLCHLAILLSLTPALLFALNRTGVRDTLAWVIGLVGTLAMTAAVSAVLYAYVEVPSIGLGRRLLARKASIAVPAHGY